MRVVEDQQVVFDPRPIFLAIVKIECFLPKWKPLVTQSVVHI
jgi:hypothetical protein